MRDAKSLLGQEAIEIANGFRRRKLDLEKEQLDLKLSLAQVKAGLEVTDLAIFRLGRFSATLGAEYQCPRCWIAQGVPSSLIPQPRDSNEDRFKCRICNYELSF
jgi:hypothetical protein